MSGHLALCGELVTLYLVRLSLVCVKVMTAASYWSLLEPALDTASMSGIYGDDGRYAFIPVSFGFAAGAAFVYGADYCLAKMVVVIVLFVPVVKLCVYIWLNDSEKSF